MREIMPYIWLGIIIFAGVVKLNMHSLAPAWLVIAGLTAFMLSLYETDVWMQALIFFALAAALTVLHRILFKKIVMNKSRQSRNAVIGSAAIVTEEINNLKNAGEIRFNGLPWSARAAEDDVIYETGLVVTITGLDGTKAVCSR